MSSPTIQRSLFEKLWQQHVVLPECKEHPALLYIDLHWIHEVTSPQGFDELRRRQLVVHQPNRTRATVDHSIPTKLASDTSALRFHNAATEKQVNTLIHNCQDFGIRLHHWDEKHHGIVHVLGPETGQTLPGSTIVCGDSHTSTHGAFGALAFGIGTTEVGHVLASQCLLQRKPKSMRIHYSGSLPTGVDAKDLALYTIKNIGVDGGTGYVIEYAGEAIRSMSMEQRMTLCNMSIEAGARAGMIAVDQITLDYLKARLPKEIFAAQSQQWLQWQSDEGAHFDKEIFIDVSQLTPMVTYGTDPGMAASVGESVPAEASPNALEYMNLKPRQAINEISIDTVFIGSCTNSRLSDLRSAASILRGHKIKPGVRMLVVPGSVAIKQAAEAEGLDQIFTHSGAEWRSPGCSMCIAMNGDQAANGKTVVSTSNRNFAGRQGPGARTILASPATAAASAIRGVVTDPRSIQQAHVSNIRFEHAQSNTVGVA